MIVAVPSVAPPVTIPVEAPIVAVGGLLVLHVPTAAASVSGDGEPEHISKLPVIGPGIPVTVIELVT